MRSSTLCLTLLCLLSACTAPEGAPGSGDDQDRADGGDGDGDLNPDLIDPDEQYTPFDGSIEAETTELTLDGSPASVTFTLKDSAGQPVSGADWTTDDTRIGSISAEGVFTANGYVGGVVIISAIVDGAVATLELTVDVNITQNPDALDTAAQDLLLGSGSADSAFEWLYPYSGTVFPRGVASPVLQFGGTAAQTFFVEVVADHFSYRLFASGTSPSQIALPEEVWRGLSLTVLPTGQATVRVTKSDGSGVTGPAESIFKFASASLKGIVYYSTYDYPTGPDTFDAAIMRVRAGQEAEVLQLGCTACHTVSANGSVLATGIDYYAGDEAANSAANPENDALNPVDSATYTLSENGDLTLRTTSSEGRLFSFLGLSPDGSVGVSNGIPADKWPPHISHGVRAVTGVPSQLIDTTTGAPVNAPTLSELITFAQSPAFSPDGTRLVFANGDILTADSNQRVLSTLNVDLTQNPPVFSQLTDVVEEVMTAVAWPTFLPDSGAIVYHEGDSLDSHKFVAPGAPYDPQYAELRMVTTSSGDISDLNALNGRNADGSSYLPYGDAEEGNMNFEASVLPVAVGGYYWVLFTSRRAYGNTIAPGAALEEENDPWGREDNPSARKKIWIAAIDVDYAGKPDPSHPAFYLPGQSVESGNMRGYAALAPCRPNGESCESGSDCCEGFCRQTGRNASGAPELSCVPPPDTCSNADELCETAADCCNPAHLCVANRCTETIVR